LKFHINKRYGNTSQQDQERVVMVGVQLPDDSEADLQNNLLELERLIETLGGKVVSTVIQRRHNPDPATFIGKGKAAEIATDLQTLKCTLVAFDSELSGGQQKNLEKELNCRVVDRTGIILDIFSRHARTKEAKNQVEMASLEYLSSHLTRRWTHLERQKGGIGLRGVGEKQIELDKRLIKTRIARLKVELEHSAKERAIQRLQRDRFLRVALVGYTNAGKSTLMNSLTDSDVYIDDRLFATLDSTVRIIDPKTRPPILLSDTVGFIKKLPTSLIASFRSTLMEVLEADLLLHVVDLSSENYLEEIEVTKKTLEDIGAGEKPSMLVFNKLDLVKEVFLPKLLERRYIDSCAVSAHSAPDAKKLRDLLYAFFERDMLELEIVIPYQDTWLQSQIHEYSKVLKKEYLDEGAKFHIRIMRSDANWLNLMEKAITLPKDSGV
jgi:GTP-binding protein HflX